VLFVYHLASNLKQNFDKSIERLINQLIIGSYLLDVDDLKCGCLILKQKK